MYMSLTVNFIIIGRHPKNNSFNPFFLCSYWPWNQWIMKNEILRLMFKDDLCNFTCHIVFSLSPIFFQIIFLQYFNARCHSLIHSFCFEKVRKCNPLINNKKIIMKINNPLFLCSINHVSQLRVYDQFWKYSF